MTTAFPQPVAGGLPSPVQASVHRDSLGNTPREATALAATRSGMGSGTLGPRFASGGVLNTFQRLFSDVYSDTGKRYAFEQTLCFTVPRTTQQLYRNFDLTGTTNKMAAWEMLLRDLMADFLDTFAPGLLAYYGVSKLLDKRHGTVTQRMMGQEGLEFYAAVAKQSPNAGAFYDQMGKALVAASSEHGSAGPTKPAVDLKALVSQLQREEAAWQTKVAAQPWWNRGVYRLRHRNPASKASMVLTQQLASQLGLKDFELSLSTNAAPNAVAKTASMTLPELLDDLKSIEINLSRRPVLAGAHWGEQVASVLAKTERLSRHHMWANALALVSSLSMPFIIRKITQWATGKDAYPGSTAIQEHMKHQLAKEQKKQQHGFAANTPHQTTPPATPEQKASFVWFPYLQQAAKAKDWVPLAGTAGFFGILATAVLRNRFWGASVVRQYGRKLNPLKWPDLIKVYQFQRGFPWTTLAQMELTYGLLCGFRLLSARNQSEWQETALRDALLGWPTLTYGFEFVQKQLGKVANRFLIRNISRKQGIQLAKNTPLLLRRGGDVRNTDDITVGLMKNATGLTGQAAQHVATMVNKAWTALTLTSMAISVTLLSFLEPKWGIHLTTNLELKNHKKSLANNAAPILNGTQQPLPAGVAPLVSHNTFSAAAAPLAASDLQSVRLRQAAFSA